MLLLSLVVSLSFSLFVGVCSLHLNFVLLFYIVPWATPILNSDLPVLLFPHHLSGLVQPGNVLEK